MAADDNRTVGGQERRQPPRAQRRYAGGAVGEFLGATAGFAVVLGCRYREVPASPVEPPQPVYPGIACGFPGGPPECSPVDCPLVRLAAGSVGVGVQRQVIESLGSALLRKVSGLFRGAPDGPAPDNAEGGR